MGKENAGKLGSVRININPYFQLIFGLHFTRLFASLFTNYLNELYSLTYICQSGAVKRAILPITWGLPLIFIIAF